MMQAKTTMVAVAATVMLFGFGAAAEAADAKAQCTAGIEQVNKLVRDVPTSDPQRVDVNVLSLQASNVAEMGRYEECNTLVRIALDRARKN